METLELRTRNRNTVELLQQSAFSKGIIQAIRTRYVNCMRNILPCKPLKRYGKLKK